MPANTILAGHILEEILTKYQPIKKIKREKTPPKYLAKKAKYEEK